mgnify:CR=1 FL=1
MLAGNVVDVAIERIADGMPVDWNALESGASGEDREFLKVLHVLDGLAELHRSTDADSSSIDASVEETTDRIPGAALGERSDVWGRHRLLRRSAKAASAASTAPGIRSSNARSPSRSSTSASPPAR